MKKLTVICLLCNYLSLISCAITPAVNHQYQLSAYSDLQLNNKLVNPVSILVNAPEAVAGYQTEQMLYLQEPYKINAFAHNAWIDPPADMLFPLILQSLQHSGYFYAVASTPSAEQTNYRLDTQLLALQQNFLTKPSSITLSAKVVLTQLKDNRVVASRVITKQIPCSLDTPYGGVLAANQASQQFTAELTQFVVQHIQQDNNRKRVLL